MPLTVEDVREAQQLRTLDELNEILTTSEPFDSNKVEVGPEVRFRIESGWNHHLDHVKPTDTVNAWVSVRHQEYQLTHESLLSAAKIAHLPASTVNITPGAVLEPFLNHWWRGGLDDSTFNMLTQNDEIARVFTKETITPFSNLELVDRVVGSIRKFYGTTDILVDYKLHHSLTATALRLIVPEHQRRISGTEESNDNWSTGIYLYNSLIGKGRTQISGYLFRYVCTNGMQDTMNESIWDRKSQGQGDDIYDWFAAATSDILGGLEHSLDRVQDTVSQVVSVEDASPIFDDIFDRYGITASDQRAVLGNAVGSELSVYSVANAVTRQANDPGLSLANQNRLLTAGSHVVYTGHDTCEACHRVLPN